MDQLSYYISFYWKIFSLAMPKFFSNIEMMQVKSLYDQNLIMALVLILTYIGFRKKNKIDILLSMYLVIALDVPGKEV